MNYRKGIQKYLLVCACALILLHLQLAVWYFGLTTYLQPFIECTPLCFTMNYIFAPIHTVLVLLNLIATRVLRYVHGKARYVKTRLLFRLMSIKVTLVAICFTFALANETGVLNSPNNFWMYSFILARFHLLVEMLDTLFTIGAITITQTKLRRELLTLKPLVAEPLDIVGDKLRWQFLAPPQGREIARYDYLVPQTPATGGPVNGFNYIESAMQEHKRKYPLVTFRPLLVIDGHTFIN